MVQIFSISKMEIHSTRRKVGDTHGINELHKITRLRSMTQTFEITGFLLHIKATIDWAAQVELTKTFTGWLRQTTFQASFARQGR